MSELDEPTEPQEIPVLVPIEALSADALTGIIQEFILREGTDYGEAEARNDTKIEQIMRQLRSGKAKLYFDARSETVTLVRT